ncbi:MAG: ECF transporter S component [Clostridia bacterium]|nr:ECF transporter S component [Clostridia bacterium]
MNKSVNVQRASDRMVFMMTRCGILAAMAVILYYLEIPVVAFYKLDLSALPALLAGFSMGPLAGFVIIVVKNVIHLFASRTAFIGELADTLMSGVFVVVASLIYKNNKTLKGAIMGMVLSILFLVVSAVLVNYFILIPTYMDKAKMDFSVIMNMVGIPGVDSMLKLVLMVTAPFNLLKGCVISVITFLLYKRLSPFLHQ